MTTAFTKSNALASAKANAKYFNRLYAVFIDTNGKWRSISEPRDTHACFSLVFPDGRIINSSAETTVGDLKQGY